MKSVFIDNVFEEGAGAEIVVENPSTEAEIARFKGASLDQVGRAIASSRKAFDSGVWSDKPAKERGKMLEAFLDALKNRTDRIQDLVMTEGGSPRATPVFRSMVAMPMAQGQQIIDYFLSLPEIEENPIPLSERVNPLGQVMQSLRRYTPIGVVVGVASYNAPFLTALWKVLPALIAGNTVILRPSPLTPISAIPFGEAAAEAGLPEGVLNIVMESGIEGAHLLTTDSQVDMVAFTGSSHVGALVMQQAAPTMKRIQLELGGKSAQIFLPDATDRVAAAARQLCTSNAGQGCALGTRIFVPEEKKAEVIEQIKVAFEGIKIGPADGADTQLGPVISASQRARCETFVKLATDAGGTIVTGGKRPAHLDKGYYFEPTILDVPDNKNPAAQDEIFGPVAVVIGYRDLDHAIEMANDSRFGLSGYVHGADKKKALEVALRIKTGTVNVNGGLMSAYVSSGGQRLSGQGRERGLEGARLYQQLTMINLGG